MFKSSSIDPRSTEIQSNHSCDPCGLSKLAARGTLGPSGERATLSRAKCFNIFVDPLVNAMAGLYARGLSPGKASGHFTIGHIDHDAFPTSSNGILYFLGKMFWRALANRCTLAAKESVTDRPCHAWPSCWHWPSTFKPRLRHWERYHGRPGCTHPSSAGNLQLHS